MKTPHPIVTNGLVLFLSVCIEALRLVFDFKQTMHHWFVDHTWTFTEWSNDVRDRSSYGGPMAVGHVHDDVELTESDAGRF